jgi:hypothetical protein
MHKKPCIVSDRETSKGFKISRLKTGTPLAINISLPEISIGTWRLGRTGSCKKEKKFAGGFYKRRSWARTGKYDRNTLAHGKSALRFRPAPDGVSPIEN